VIINGKMQSEMVKGTVIQVLSSLELQMERVVVEVNGEIIPKANYSTHLIDEESKVEIVSFVGGG
jgi:sulfur carrier protein